MRVRELAKRLAVMIEAGLPILIKGAPGIGKSDLVAQATEVASARLILMHPVVSDPTDFKGLPANVDGKAEFLPFGDLRELIEATELTVCFLDDLGQAPPVVQAAAMQLILARRVNGHMISDKVVFIAATNRREDRAGVTAILEPVKSRFASILELTVNVDDWCEWALGPGEMPAELVAFIRFRPDMLMDKGTPTNDIVNRPCPRTMTFAGKLLKVGLTDLETLAGAIGEGAATELVGFLKVWEQLPDVDSILLSPETATVPSEPAALYAISTVLAQRASKDNARRIIKYLKRLPEEFTVLALRDAIRRCPEIAKNRTFITWATDNQELLS